jgi:ATP-dependent DNA helicase RecG
MSEAFLHTGIEYLKGVGPERGRLLKEDLGIRRFKDLLEHYPFRYVDRTKVWSIEEVRHAEEQEVQLVITLRDLREVSSGNKKRLVGIAHDGQHEVELIWFKGFQWINRSLQLGQRYVLFGKPSKFMNRLSFIHPELEGLGTQKEFKGKGLQPVYSTSEKLTKKGLGSSGIARLTAELIRHPELHKEEHLPESWLKENRWPVLTDAVKQIHFPASLEQLHHAKERLKFDEFLFLQLHMLRQKIQVQRQYKGWVFERVGELFNKFYKDVLPFDLTSAQKRVLREIRADMGSGKQMNRLLQGDVGSGKTIVALMSMLLAADNGHQACLMAPTEILANQHYQSLSELLSPFGLEIRLLTGSTKKAERREIHNGIESGELLFLVGTHALLEDKVKFKSLGLAVIDEQHRFGVAQRARLWSKNERPPHVLVMTATPIPRTLAMSVHGDLDVSVIDELPPGRKAIKTIYQPESRRLEVIGFLKKEIAKGRQVYIVYPLIEESAKLDYKNLMEGFEHIQALFPRPDCEVSIVHGRMKPEEKDFEMQRFVAGTCQILVATTVIEVGVNVPNASVMLIESVERFGLSQLHQLRGRVGRGAEQSYCLLMSGQKLSKEAKHRIETMVRTQDGFEIAEEDLKIRGPGDLMGTQQSGQLELKLGSLIFDGALLQLAREKALGLLSNDPNLSGFPNLIRAYRERYGNKLNWGRIS